MVDPTLYPQIKLNSSSCNLEPIAQSRKCVYYPQLLTKNLIEYDILSNTQIVHNLEPYSQSLFFHASLCLLPNGDVFISSVSILRNFESTSLLFRLRLQDCIKLPKLKKELKSTSLIFYKDSVYAIAGFEVPFTLTRYVQRFDFNSNRWTILNSLQHPRLSSSLLINHDKIAIFGCGVNSIEEYDPLSEISTLIPSDFLNTFSIAYLHDDSIYLIQENQFLTLGLDYQLRYARPSNKEGNVVSCASAVFWKDKLYYFNNQEIVIEIVDILTGEVR